MPGCPARTLAVSASMLASVMAAPVAATWAQEPVSRATATAAALARSPRVAVARADSIAASAGVALARQFENPSLGAQFTKDAPQQHYTLDVPLDLPWFRGPRIGGSRAALDAALLRYAWARAAIVYDVDTTYTRALAESARARLSARNAHDADSLLKLAQLRRDAGDASELDVQLASVFAGQIANAATVDSVRAVDALLAVQLAMGRAADTPTITLTDSLSLDKAPAVAVTGAVAIPGGPGASDSSIRVVAARHDVRSADLGVMSERRRLLGMPALTVGVETGDPGGVGGALPLVGIALPLPLFNRNSASIQVAQAAAARARAQLAQTQLETAAELSQALREARATTLRAERSARLVTGADRIASLSLLAYREGASTLPAVLEAQRTAREALGQYFDDIAAARNAAGRVRLLSLTATPGHP